jgi:hypothetical protein
MVRLRKLGEVAPNLTRTWREPKNCGGIPRPAAAAPAARCVSRLASSARLLGLDAFAVAGVLSFIVGLYALRHLLVTIVALAVILGIFWIVNGAIEIFTALTDDLMHGRGWIVLMGLLSIAAGIVVLVWPGISLLTLAVVLGVWLLVLGIMEIVFAFQLRSLGRTVGQMAPAT